MEADNIAVHETSEDTSAIVKFIPVDKFPAPVRLMVSQGQVYGAHVQNGKVIVVDIWGDHHITEVEVNA